MDSLLKRENKFVLDVVQATLGLISRDMLAISIGVTQDQVMLYFVVRERNHQVDEDIEEIIFELRTLQSGPIEVNLSVHIGLPNADWPGISGRRVFVAKDAVE